MMRKSFLKKALLVVCLSGILLSCKKETFHSVDAEGNTSSDIALAPSENEFREGPTQEAVAARLGFRGQHNDMQATGFYVAPGDSITVTVTPTAGTSLPVLAVGTPFRDAIRPVRTYHNLVAGTQTLPGDMYGGLIYIRYVTAGTPSAAAKVKFEAGCKPVPYYKKGVTTHQQWLAALDSIDNVPDVVFESDRTVLVTTLTDAITYKDENQDLIVSRLDSIIESQDAISGLDNSSADHTKPPYKHLITVRDRAAGGYMAAGIAIYFTQSLSYRMLQPQYLSNVNGWGIWHEVGHTYQQAAWTWDGLTETTVNVYSMASERLFALPDSRITINNSWPKLDTFLAKPLAERDYNAGDNDLKLIMFHQLWLAFGDQLYIQLSRKTREEKPTLSTTAEKMRYFMLRACTISGKDLSDFFRKWGFNVNESVYDEIAHLNLPSPTEDLTLLRDE
ncbi:M60 family metallopeptidase [Olivibacter sp. CPCC 100613]|uniref:M60 family metallopeptidase n=1 Tax=Olivibacter sp. CPCC 100613 TaxID=3079931 RepID=UPI002FF9B3DA